MSPFKTISIFGLAILVLISSSNFMVGIHFCAGEIQNIGFLARAEACEMEQKQPPCHQHMTAPCCEEETIVHKGEELKSAFSQVHISPPVLDVVDVAVLIAEIIPATPFSQSYGQQYDPPLWSYDRTISHQIFLL